MSARDGVDDEAYDRLRAAGFSREQCWAVLDANRKPVTPRPSAAKEASNRAKSGVRQGMPASSP